MICAPCKKGDHGECPAMPKPYDQDKPTVVHPTGLSEQGNRIQRSGVCPCQHRARLMSPITLKEAEEKVRAGLKQDCGCGARIAAGPEEPKGEEASFVMFWFEDHSYEDLSKHGLLIKAKTQAMRVAAAK